MSETTRAVFISYASQDADAATRICGALRAAGIEVWLDQSELVGGDAWDQQIRRQIKECALRDDPVFEKLLRDNLPPGAKPLPERKGEAQP